ncbi:MAG: FtsQ-type POTRA domain-containing protein [Clostridiales bacterium]|nr:FtsQ-type POTRA domain-containing protein [Clostridiales bacterium]
MEPSWQPNQQPQQGSGRVRPSAWSDEGEYVQKPLGVQEPPRGYAPQTGYQLVQQGQGTQSQPYAGGQAWQGYPPQPSAAPTPSNPWATGSVDPFDEPAEAPELRDQRSDHLYNKEDRFWDHVEGSQKTGRHGSRPHRGKAESHTMRWVILILVVLVGVGLAVYSAVFQVRDITVQGGITLSEKEIVDISGITLGMNTFAIDDDLVEKNIESNRYLSFVCVDKQLPDKVVIQVKERVEAAAVKYCGILYTMDNRGMVLEEYLDTERHTGLVLVDGMDIHDCRVGQAIGLNDESQMQVVTEVLVELKVMSALGQVKELDLSNMDNLFIVSDDDFTVRIGAPENLHAKLRSMLLTLNHLRQEGYDGGTVDVSTPVNPTYIPES